MVQVTEIAKRVGVSKGLVSRVLREDKTLRISDGRRREILAVAESLEGQPIVTSTMKSRKRLAHNFVIPCFGKELFEEFKAHYDNQAFNCLKAVLAEHGFRISIAMYSENEEVSAIANLVTSPNYCDGLILVRPPQNEETAKFILDRKFPHICMDFGGKLFGLNTVNEDLEIHYYLAIRHLYELGHRRIGFLGRKETKYPWYVAAMARMGLSVQESWFCANPKLEDGIPTTMAGWRDTARKSFGEWLDRGPTATAMICPNDYGALGAMDAMLLRGMTPGREISLVGGGNIEPKEPSTKDNPCLTTFSDLLGQTGTRAGRILLNQVLYNHREIVHEHLPVNLIVRQSTGPCNSEK